MLSAKSFLNEILLLAFLQLSIFSQYRNVRINDTENPGQFEPCEVSITINPVNPNIIAAGAVLDYLFLSSDAGETWNQSLMNSDYGVWGDPSLAFDKWGNLFYAHLSSPPHNIGYWIDRIVIQKSSDNGLSWENVTGLGYNPPRRNQDKEWVTPDWTNSPNMGNVYVAWTEFDAYSSSNSEDSSRIRFTAFDYGARKWSTPVRVNDISGDCIDGDNTVEGAVPAVGPNGEVYLSWSGPVGIVFDKSTDEGITWGRDVFVNPHIGGWDMYIPGVPRCNGMPVTCCDISNSAYRGNIYINWVDLSNGESNPDVFVAKSTDGGETWNNPVRVNDDDTQRPQFFTWMSVDPKTGYIYVVFYDRRNTTGNITDVYLARSKDGGDNFENFLISESSFDFPENFPLFFGDYNNIAAYNGKIYPAWTRVEVNDPAISADDKLSIMVATIADNELVTGTDPENIIEDYQLFPNYPNPFNPATLISYQIPEKSHVTLKIYDVLGREVRVLEDEIKKSGFYETRFDGGDLSSGSYIYKLKAGKYSASGKMLLLK